MRRRRAHGRAKPDRPAALELLDGCGVEGCTEAILYAHGLPSIDGGKRRE
jgi:hypothetical protein